MLTALIREVSRSLAACELTWQSRQPIDFDLARQQHRAYENALRGLGLRVISLPEEPDLPDAVFVEDPLIVVDELAIITNMGAPSRRAETASLEEAISPYRKVRRIQPPGTLEGGDVMRIGRDVFAGLSVRTNAKGIEQLAHELAPFGYRVHSITVRGCLHLKSAVCPISDSTLLVNRDLLDAATFGDYALLDVPPEEPGAANVLRIGNSALLSAVYPRTADLLSRSGLAVHTLDISELMKAEAAMTCSSVIFDVVE